MSKTYKLFSCSCFITMAILLLWGIAENCKYKEATDKLQKTEELNRQLLYFSSRLQEKDIIYNKEDIILKNKIDSLYNIVNN